MLRAFFVFILTLVLAAPARAAERTVFEVQWAGVDAIATSPKDAFLRAALANLGPRLMRLPAEIGEDPAELGAMIATWESIHGASSIKLVVDDAPGAAAPRIRMRMEFTPTDPAKAAELTRMLNASAEQSLGPPIDPQAALRKYRVDDKEVAIGTREGVVVVMLNGLDRSGPPAGRVEGTPADLSLLMRVHIDGPALSTLLDQAPTTDPLGTAQGKAALAALGLYGPDAVTIDGGMWRTGRGLEGEMTFRGARRHWMPGEGAAPTLGAPFLAKLPADVTSAGAMVFDVGLLDRVITAIDPAERVRMSQQARDAIGFDPFADLFAHLGERFAWYQSDRTGGGGVMSSVALVELANPTAFAETHAKIVTQINGLGAGPGRGYVRIAEATISGHPAFVLHTPGLPFPVSITWGIVDHTLIAGITPAAFAEAIGTATRADGSLATHPDITDRVGDGAANLAAISFGNTARLAKAGVGSGLVLMTALGNLARTPVFGDGPLPPTALELVEGVQPGVCWNRWNGDDLVMRWTTDGSLTVLATVAAGRAINGASWQTMPMMAGILLPAVAGARANAMEVKSSIQIREICRAYAEWVEDHNGVPPPMGSGSLLEADMFPLDMLQSPYGPQDRILFDYFTRADLTQATSDPSVVLVVDFAALVNGAPKIPVGFADGHVKALTQDELNDLLAQPQNHGMRKALGLD
jgi:hypothetical protein